LPSVPSQGWHGDWLLLQSAATAMPQSHSPLAALHVDDPTYATPCLRVRKGVCYGNTLRCICMAASSNWLAMIASAILSDPFKKAVPWRSDHLVRQL